MAGSASPHRCACGSRHMKIQLRLRSSQQSWRRLAASSSKRVRCSTRRSLRRWTSIWVPALSSNRWDRRGRERSTRGRSFIVQDLLPGHQAAARAQSAVVRARHLRASGPLGGVGDASGSVARPGATRDEAALKVQNGRTRMIAPLDDVVSYGSRVHACACRVRSCEQRGSCAWRVPAVPACSQGRGRTW